MSRAIACPDFTLADVPNHRAYADVGLPDGNLAREYMAEFFRGYDSSQTKPEFIIALQFEALAHVLVWDTFALSNPRQVLDHQAFQRIRDLGDVAIPLIMKRLEKEPFVWLNALPVLIGKSPVKPEHRGRVASMVADWKDWACNSGLLTED